MKDEVKPLRFRSNFTLGLAALHRSCPLCRRPYRHSSVRGTTEAQAAIFSHCLHIPHTSPLYLVASNRITPPRPPRHNVFVTITKKYLNSLTQSFIRFTH